MLGVDPAQPQTAGGEKDLKKPEPQPSILPVEPDESRAAAPPASPTAPVEAESCDPELEAKLDSMF